MTKLNERYRLHSMPSAQCHIHIVSDDEKGTTVDLISYETLVCSASLFLGELSLYCTGTYSTTTARHINRFTTEFFGKNLYRICKLQAGKGRVLVTTNESDISDFIKTINNYKEDSFAFGKVKRYYGRY